MEVADRTIHEKLWCTVERLHYAVGSRTGSLFFARNNCCDMRGAIALFEAIDPMVMVIDTWADGWRDTIYRRQADGWKASDPRSMPA